ncbi:hypothetical protein JTE90_022016 [Oedothorax gibbosus]|uniref:Uncharacterized protein n=1 Tax=Oedothorax gibbosus TaxID=931172 RepID=A0AAV6V220_9ARAC|nr:hypothetical protein JTE90_022016 [Oedothorax gibbosus]
MNGKILDDIDVVRKLKSLKGMTATIRKKLEDCILEKILFFKPNQEALEKAQLDSLIFEDYSVKEQSTKKASFLPRICNQALEKDAVQNKIANTSANVNSFVAINRALLNEDIENTSNENSFMDPIFLYNFRGTDLTNNSSESFDNEELEPDKLIIIEIYRKLSNFFEIAIVTPFALIIEDHFEILKFGLALFVCTIYAFFTNANKKMNSTTKEKDPHAKSISPFILSEFSSVTSHPPVKNSDFIEPLIILKSNNNSKEELNLRDTELYENVNEKISVKLTLKNIKNPSYENGPNNNYELSRCEEKISKFNEFDSLLLGKCQLYPNYCHAEIEEVTIENSTSESNDKNDEKLEEKVEAGDYFKEICGLDLKNELVEELTNVFNKEADIFVSPPKEGFSCTIPWKDKSTLLKVIELNEFENQSEFVYMQPPINEIEEKSAETETHFNISDISQMSTTSFSAEPRLLDIDETLFQNITQSNDMNFYGIEQEFEEKHPLFIDNLEQDIFSEEFETKYESITPFLSNILSTKTVYEHGERFLESPNSYVGELSDLYFYNQPGENNLLTIPNANNKLLEFQCICNEFENENEENTMCKFIGDSSICDGQDNNKVISLVQETSMELSFDTFNFIDTAYATEDNKILTESTEVPMFIKESKITEGTANNFEVGDDNFDKILPKNNELNPTKIVFESNNSSLLSSKVEYLKCNELPIESYVECPEIEEVADENVTGEEINLPEYDPIEECKTIVTTYTHIAEYVPDEVEDLTFTQNFTKKISRSNEMMNLKNGEKINTVCNIEHSENENCNRNNTHNKIPQTLTHSQDFNDTLEANGSFQGLKYIDSSEENIEQPSFDIVTERRSFDSVKISQEKSIDLHKIFSCSMPDVRDINVDELVTCKMNMSLNYTNTFLALDLGSSYQKLLEASLSFKLSPSNEENRIVEYLHNLPQIILPSFKQNSTNEDFQWLPSNAAEPFETELPSPSSSFKNATTVLGSEVKADGKKNKKQKSFRSKVSTVFNGVRKLQGRMLTAAGEIKNYKKQKNYSFD